MTAKKKSKAAVIKELIGNLHYWQMMYRIELSGLRRIKDRQMEIVARIKKIKEEE